MPEDDDFMRLALEEARKAAAAGEIPIGAVAVRNGVAVAAAHNRVEELRSVTAHAELELLRRLEHLSGDWRMEQITVFVTKEPCPMCAGALVNARVARIVHGVPDPRWGGCTVFAIPESPGALWHPEVRGGVLADECAALLGSFFRNARGQRKNSSIRMRNSPDSAHIRALNVLMRQAFGGDFNFWFELGAWNDRYESNAIFEGERMIAHVGLFRMKLSIAGRECKAIQINGVACAEEARGRGLARKLIESILRRYSGTPVFLLANDAVLDFYPRFGFRPARMERPVLECAIDNDRSAVRISAEKVRPLLNARRPASKILDAVDCREIRLFHLFGEWKDSLYEIAPGSAVAADVRDGVLQLHDLYGRWPSSWNALRSSLPFRGIRKIEFGFCPDRLGAEFRWEPSETDKLFLHGAWELPDHFRIPDSAQT